MATKIGNLLTLDGSFSDWPAADMIMTAANAVAGYQVYGALLQDATLGSTYVLGIAATATTDLAIAAGTVIYLNTDQNNTTGYSPFGHIGAEYEIQFALDATSVLQPYLYSVSATGVATPVAGGAPLAAGFSSDGESVDLAIPQSLLPSPTAALPTSIDVAALIDNAVGLPSDFSAAPEYVIPDPAASAPIKVGNLITLDGTFADWPGGDAVATPGNTVAGYQLYGALLSDAVLGKTYVIGIDATAGTDPAIGAGSTIYLNTDQNTATGYSPFGSIGAEYEVQFAYGTNAVLQPYLYSVTPTGATTLLNGGAPLAFGVSSNGASLELAIPQALLTGGAAPQSINFAALINNAVALPGDFASNPEYTITDPSTLVPVNTAVKKVGIVFSATTAAQYFGGGPTGTTAYSDLFLSAQHQAEAAGVSYDILTEADLTNVAKLAQYSALVFPSFQNVQSSQASAIASALHQVVYNYHVPIITAGGFMTSDQNGQPLAGNSYATMEDLLNLNQTTFGTATYTVTPNAAALAAGNPALQSFTPGELIGGSTGLFPNTTAGTYTNYGYLGFAGYTQPATTIADLNIQGGGTLPGIVQTTTGATNTVFATTEIEGDSNVLQHAIQSAAFGTTPSLALDTTRFAGILNSRNDTEDSQYTDAVSPSNGTPGIYTQLLPMLQQWEKQYDFVGTYFINVGDGANPNNGNVTNWAVSKPIYDQLLQMGNEIGSHSYTHLINPPSLEADGVTPVPTVTVATSEGVQTVNSWAENTNTLYVTPPADAPNWTFAYEFGTGNSVISANLGIPVAGAAVPGANDTVATAGQIEQYYQSAALPAGMTGYVEGGYTGPDSGSPNAFGYIDPSHTGSVYIAPNVTFDFTEIQFQNKTPAQALTDWESLFGQLSANSSTPIIVWPWHDYGPTNFNDTTPGSPGPGYNQAMFTDFIAYAYNAGYEFVTGEELASRIAAQQAATLSETTSGSVITATVTPGANNPDLGAMALNVINGGAGQVIKNVGTWYAYDTNSVFVPYGGGSFTVTLGTAQDDATHIDFLPMRADLLSVSGDGTNLNFAMTGDGTVKIALKNVPTNIVSIQGAPSASLSGNALSLTFADVLSAPSFAPLQHNVAVYSGAKEIASAQNEIVFGTAGNDVFFAPGAGHNTLYGNGGTDTIVFSAAASNYSVVTNADGSKTVTDLRAGSPEGTDTLFNIANVLFGPPTLVSIAASGTRITNGSGDVGAGAVVTLTVTFSQAVVVAGGVPTLALNDGGTASYTGGSGTNALTFSYTVQTGQNTAALQATSVVLPSGTTIQNAAGMGATLTPVPALSGTLQIDTIVPAISSITTSGTGIVAGAGVLDVGNVVTFTVTLTEAVTVTGAAPSLLLNNSGVATYTGGSGTNVLSFKYTVAAGQSTPDLAVASFNLQAGSTIQNGAGTNANLAGATNYNPAGTLRVAVGTTQITSITTSGPGIVAGTGDLNAGKAVTLTVNFSQAVTVAGGSPTLTLDDGGTATFTGGSGTSALTFNYVVKAGQNSNDLQVYGLVLPAGTTITDVRGTSAGLAVANGYNPAGVLQIDTTPPTISSIKTSGTGITNGAGTLPVGSVVTLTATFSEKATIGTGTPTLTLNDGGTASYVSGSGTNTWVFSYTVQPGQNTPDLTVTGLSGATVLDGAGNPLALPIATINPAGVLAISTATPTIAITAVAGNNIVNLTKALTGFNITGTTTGVESGQVVTVKLLNAAAQVVGTVSGTDNGTNWTATVPPLLAALVADGTYSASASVSNKVGLAATPATLSFVVDEDKTPEMPTLKLASTALTVTAGGSIPLGITATPVDSDDVLSLTIKGLPAYEKIVAPGATVTSTQAANGTYTWTVTGAAGATLSGLSLSSSYTGTGHPVATLSITASNAADGGQPKQTTAAQTLVMTDPPASSGSGTFPITPATSSLTLNVAANAPAQFAVTVDGQSFGSFLAASGNPAGQTQAFTITGIPESFTPHDLAISFLGGTASAPGASTPTLTLASIQFDGARVPGWGVVLHPGNTDHFTVSAPANWAA